MSRANRTLYVRIGIIVALVGGVLVWGIWRTSQVSHYAEVTPGLLYIAAAPSAEAGVYAVQKAEPNAVFIAATEQQANESPLADVTRYCFRQRIRVYPISTDQGLSNAQLKEIYSVLERANRRPGLVLSLDGVASGKIAVMHRLEQEQWPLEQVQALAELPDAPAAVTEEIQAFARRYVLFTANQASSGAPGAGATTVPAEGQ